MAVKQRYTVWWVYILSIWLLATSGLVAAAEPEGILLGKRIKVSTHEFEFNQNTGNYDTALALINKSKPKQTLYGPLTLVISSADQTDINLINASGHTAAGLPYLSISLPESGLKPGERIKGIPLTVNNPSKKKFKLRYAIYGFLAPYYPDNKPPSMVQLVGVSSLSGDSLSAEWMPTTDDQTPPDQLIYTLHLADSAGFIPSAATAKLTATGIISGTVNRLAPATRYYVKVSAMDNQGKQSWSNELTVLTAETPIKRTAAKVYVQQAQSAPQITDTTISYSDTNTPQIGEFLTSAENGGYLRKVTGVAKQGNQVTATTESASLNQIFENLDINTTIKLEPLPASTQPAAQPLALAARSMPSQNAMTWPKTGLQLIDNQVSTLPVTSTFKAAALNVQAASLNGNQQTTTGQYTDFSGPASVAIAPGNAGIFTVNALVPRAFIDQGVTIPLKVCSMRSLGLTHNDPAKRILLNNEQNPALRPQFGTLQPDPADQSASLTTQWSPDAKYVHDGGLPYYATYEVTVGEYAKTAGDTDCAPTLFNLSGWQDKLMIKIPIYITMGDIPPKETKSLTFSGGLTVTDNLTFGVKPEFDIAARIRNFQLQDATLAVNADIEFQNELLIQGNAGATLDQTLEVLAPRKFVRVFAAGPVPIVVSGEFGMNLRVQGKAAGTVNLSEVIRYAFPQTRFGLAYQNGQWTEISNFQPEYQFTIKGDGDAGAELTLTLVPDLQIHFYDAASGRMLVEPYLYAQANIHGNFLYQDASGNFLPYSQLPDYWFTDLQGGGGVNLSLYAGLHIFDYNVASYPVGVTVNQTGQFAKVAAIPKTAIAAIPKLSAVVDYTVKPATGSDTRAVLIKGQFQELANPFKGLFGLNPDPFANPYVQFSKWTEPKVFTSQRAAKVVSDLTVEPDAFWLNYVEPGTYRVRLSGESDLGWFVRLVAEDPNLGQNQGISVEIVLTDNDNDGMVDQWESQWGVDDPAADPDQDLATNLDEFKAGTNPIIADPGQRLAVSVTGDGSVSSTPTGNSGGILDCRATSGICNDGFDLPMGATITLTATAGSGSQFVGWSGTDGGGCPVPQAGALEGSCTVALDGTAKSVSAQFVVNQPNPGAGYTKIGADGGLLPVEATTWSCVKDNSTGLIWEVKTADGGLRDWLKGYTNFSLTYPTDPSSPSWQYGDANDASGFANAVNTQGLCGANDWRLPTNVELLSIVVQTPLIDPRIDSAFFPNTAKFDYWSSTPVGGNDHAIGITFFGGPGAVGNQFYYRWQVLAVRLVRTGP
jgi:hypothetical protein